MNMDILLDNQIFSFVSIIMFSNYKPLLVGRGVAITHIWTNLQKFEKLEHAPSS